MPFLKNIGLKSKKGAAAAPEMSVSIIATATGSAGYYTSSIIDGINRIYTGACDFDPHYINITFSTSSVVGGTAPYVTKWTSSMLYYPPGYTSGTETGSFTGKYYAYESDRWTVTVTDSSTPAKIASASIHSVIYGIGFEIIVGKLDGNVATGSDTQLFDPLILPGGPDAPLATIGAGIRYSVPDNTYIYVASGTYAENPVIDKKILQIQSADGTNSASLAQGNYFIYATKEFGDVGLRSTGVFSTSWAFTTSSFDIIGVTPSGSIQNAVYDVQPSGTVYILAGVHEINTPISTSYGKAITFQGIHVPTGSTDTYIYNPQTILRMTNVPNSIFVQQSEASPVGRHRYTNMALEINDTGSFFTIANGNSRTSELEMVRFRMISQSIAYDMKNFGYNQTDGWMNQSSTPIIYRNPRKNLILDAQESVQGYGSGNIRHRNYGPIHDAQGLTVGPGLVLGLATWVEAGFANNTTSGSNSGAVSDDTGNTYGTNTFPSRQPRFGFGDSHFLGLPYLYYTGATGTSINYNETNIISTMTTASYSGFIVFKPSATGSATVPRRVVYKWGDHLTGFSWVVTGSQICTSVYASSSLGVISSASMFANMTLEETYLGEIFFDGLSTNKRVGMALYDTNGLVTSSYFSSTQFPATRAVNSAVGAANVTSIGCASGYIRVGDFTKTALTRTDQFLGRWALTALYHGTGSVSNKHCKQVYDFIRWKYYPTSSIVTRSLSSDVDV